MNLAIDVQIWIHPILICLKWILPKSVPSLRVFVLRFTFGLFTKLESFQPLFHQVLFHHALYLPHWDMSNIHARLSVIYSLLPECPLLLQRTEQCEQTYLHGTHWNIDLPYSWDGEGIYYCLTWSSRYQLSRRGQAGVSHFLLNAFHWETRVWPCVSGYKLKFQPPSSSPWFQSKEEINSLMVAPENESPGFLYGI